MEKEKISIIIPTRNRSNYLKRAIESVLQQSYQNIEIIVVDDASTDDTENIVRSFRDPRIIYIKNDKRRGPNFCRNLGLKKSSGEYIAFLDDDDYYSDRDKLKKQIELFKKNKNLGFVGSAYYSKGIQMKRVPNVRGKIAEKLLITFPDIETSTILIKRDVIEKIGLWDTNFKSQQNRDFFYRISKVSEFDFLPEITVIKDAPQNQISKNIKDKLQGYILFHKKHFNDIKNLPFRKFVFVMLKFSFGISVLIIELITGNYKILAKLYEMTRKKEIKNQ